MESLFNDWILSRLRFAVMAMFHIIWPVLTIGLSLYVAVLEAWDLEEG